jgi:hypothetical protein
VVWISYFLLEVRGFDVIHTLQCTIAAHFFFYIIAFYLTWKMQPTCRDLVDLAAQGIMVEEGLLLVQDDALTAVLMGTGPEIARLVTGKISATAVGTGATLKETARTAPRT